MVDQSELLPAVCDTNIRKYIAKNCRLPDVHSEEVWAIRGQRVSFYKNTWLCYAQRTGLGSGGAGTPHYFLAQTTARRKVTRIVPVANQEGAVDRANRELTLDLNQKNLIDYLNFYYAFTPKADPVAPLSGGPTQYWYPEQARI